MRVVKFWPLDDDPEDPIYDSPAWDLPGFRKPDGKPRPVRGIRVNRHKTIEKS